MILQVAVNSLFVRFAGRKPERNVYGTPPDQTCHDGYNADQTPPALEIKTRQENNDTQRDPYCSVNAAHITFHMPPSFLLMVKGSDHFLLQFFASCPRPGKPV